MISEDPGDPGDPVLEELDRALDHLLCLRIALGNSLPQEPLLEEALDAALAADSGCQSARRKFTEALMALIDILPPGAQEGFRAEEATNILICAAAEAGYRCGVMVGRRGDGGR